jgi:hypothetical protein
MVGKSLTHALLVGSAIAIPYISAHTDKAGHSLLSRFNREETASSSWSDNATDLRSSTESALPTSESTSLKDRWNAFQTRSESPAVPASNVDETPSLAARWSDRSWGNRGAFESAPQATLGPPQPADPFAANTATNTEENAPSNPPGTGSTQSAPTSIEEILSFDINPGYVVSHWPRITTMPPQYQLQGYRTSVVTGTRETDIAGTITYYFDTRQQLERIIFYGTTGDPRALLTLLSSKFGMERVYNDDPGTFIYRKNVYFKPYSELRIRPAKVFRASDPNARYEIELAVRKP